MVDKPNQNQSVKLFVSYSHKDEELWEKLNEHLAPLRRAGKISSWHDRKLLGGSEFAGNIDAELAKADIVLLLVSASFIASDYCFDIEMAQALERHEAGQARVIPLILRPCDWTGAPFAKLMALPKDGRPVTSWPSIDEGLLDAANGLRKVVDDIAKEKTEPPRKARADLIPIAKLFEGEMLRLDQSSRLDIAFSGLSTGFADLDDILDGLHRGEVCVVAGRPAMPKGAFALNVASHVAAHLGVPTAFFCPKTKATEIARRMTAVLANVSQKRMLRAQLGVDDWNRIAASLSSMNAANLFIDDSPELTVREIREKTLHKKKELGTIGLVVIDNLHTLKAQRSETQATAIARELGVMARELDVPVLVTLPVSRAVETRPNRRPVERDLGEWAGFEDEASQLLFVYQDDVYWQESPDRGSVELIVARNAHGPIGTVRLNYDAGVEKFTDYAFRNARSGTKIDPKLAGIQLSEVEAIVKAAKRVVDSGSEVEYYELYEPLKSAIEALAPSKLAVLLALMWFGRESEYSSLADWWGLREDAVRAVDDESAGYIAEKVPLATYLKTGLEKLTSIGVVEDLLGGTQ